MSGSGQFTMTAQEMTAFAKRIAEAIHKIQQEQTKLLNTVSNITGGWQGQAATAYKNLQHSFTEDVKALNASLHAIQEAIERTTQQYARTEAEQAQQFTGAQG
ncbi:WXG100 family type VII secretion target [Kitasatospora sp. NPDC051170]|uniref:WXG100 family type VII secretion target n=1 Tax=Kitasatospora sp. NPDC051170 TaxID=3364056 RepID=UPI003790CD10